MSDVIQVEARFGKDGKILPLAFIWEERRFSVTALGRQWQEGLKRHFLVMASGEQVFEITFSEEEGIWCIGRSPAKIRGNRMTV